MIDIDYARIQAAARAVIARTAVTPRIAVVLGSSQGRFAERVAAPVSVPYDEIPGMPTTGVSGHAGVLTAGTAAGVPAWVFAGRAHMYEGHSARAVAFSMRLAHAAGARAALLTNAAGGVNRNYAVGDCMLIRDHINLTFANPLVGPLLAPHVPRFPDMTTAYDAEWRARAHAAAAVLGLRLHEGVYLANLGPTYETPAEIGMAARLGADAVGMSTVPEVIAARALGLKVAGLSLITNAAAGYTGTALSHEEVKAAGEAAGDGLFSLIEALVAAALLD